jgi:hypothetical protein
LFFSSNAFAITLLLGGFALLDRERLHADTILFEHLPRTTLNAFERFRDWINFRAFARFKFGALLEVGLRILVAT